MAEGRNNSKLLLEKIVRFKEMIDEILEKSSFSEELKQRVSDKLKNITEICIRIEAMGLANKSTEEIEVFFEENNINSDFIDLEIDTTTKELFRRAKSIDIPQNIKKQMAPINDYFNSTKSTINSTKALMPIKKKSFFDKFYEVFTENPDEDWIREDIEEDGKHIVRYKDEFGNIRSEYIATENIEENEKKDEKARKFGLIARLKAVFNQKETDEVEIKAQAMEKQGEDIEKEAIKQANEYLEKFLNKAPTLENVLKLLKDYPWIEEIKKMADKLKEMKEIAATTTKPKSHTKQRDNKREMPGLEH